MGRLLPIGRFGLMAVSRGSVPAVGRCRPVVVGRSLWVGPCELVAVGELPSYGVISGTIPS